MSSRGYDSECWCCGDVKLPTVRFVILLCVIYKLEPPWILGTESFVDAFLFMNKMPTQTCIEEKSAFNKK